MNGPVGTARVVIRVWLAESTKGPLAEVLVTMTEDLPGSPRDSGDWHTANLAREGRRNGMWQIYDPAGDVSTVHDTETEFVRELTESLRTSSANTELRVSRLAG